MEVRLTPLHSVNVGRSPGVGGMGIADRRQKWQPNFTFHKEVGMVAEAMFVITAVVVTVGIFVQVGNTRRLTTLYGKELHAYNIAAFNEVTEDSPDGHFSYVTKLATEVESTRGQKAILVRTSENGTAIHHVNQDGTFSAKGPYFISWRSGNWHTTGRTHLVKVLRGKGSWGMAPDHYNQRGIISERGLTVLEYNTVKYPPLSIREFADKKTGRLAGNKLQI